jgi:hypothetical protein
MVGVRFDAVEPSMARGLSELIELLLSTTTARIHARAARRIEIRFSSLGELRGILHDIVGGGLIMTISEPLSLFEDVDVIVPDLGGTELLTLHGRVTHQRMVEKGAIESYQVGVEMHQARPEVRGCVEAILRQVDEELGPSPPGESESETPHSDVGGEGATSA